MRDVRWSPLMTVRIVVANIVETRGCGDDEGSRKTGTHGAAAAVEFRTLAAPTFKSLRILE